LGFGFINALGVVLQKNRKIFLKNENLEEEICFYFNTRPNHSKNIQAFFEVIFERSNLTFENAILRFAVKNQKQL